jgi:hypothetical protein
MGPSARVSREEVRKRGLSEKSKMKNEKEGKSRAGGNIRLAGRAGRSGHQFFLAGSAVSGGQVVRVEIWQEGLPPPSYCRRTDWTKRNLSAIPGHAKRERRKYIRAKLGEAWPGQV